MRKPISQDTISNQSQPSTAKSSHNTSIRSEDQEGKLHHNAKVNKLRQKAQELKLEFRVEGPITKDEEVIAIVNKSTDPRKHGREAPQPDETCSPTLTVRSQARFAAEHNFTWTNDVIGTVKPNDDEVQVMVQIRKTSKALLVTDFGYGLTTLEFIAKDKPVFLYEGEVEGKDFDSDCPYGLIVNGEGRNIHINAEQKRGYGGFAQHLFEPDANYMHFYEFTPEDKSRIAMANVAAINMVETTSARVLFYAISNILPLSHIGYPYSAYYFKKFSIPMAPFSLIDGFSLKYKIKGYQMDLIYPEIDERAEITEFLDNPIDSKINQPKLAKAFHNEMQTLKAAVHPNYKPTGSLVKIKPLKENIQKQGYTFINGQLLIRDQDKIKIMDYLAKGVALFTLKLEPLPVALYMMATQKMYLDCIQKFNGLTDNKELALLDNFLQKILTLLALSKQPDLISEKRKVFFETLKATVTAQQQILHTQSQLPTTMSPRTQEKEMQRLFSTYKITTQDGNIEQQKALLLRKVAAVANLVNLQWFLNLCEAKQIPKYINQTTSKGKTPLHLAADSKKASRLAVCMLLLRKKADPTIADSGKNTPYQYIAGNPQLMLLFKQNQAQPPGSYQIKPGDLDPDKLYAGIAEDVNRQGFKFKAG